MTNRTKHHGKKKYFCRRPHKKYLVVNDTR